MSSGKIYKGASPTSRPIMDIEDWFRSQIGFKNDASPRSGIFGADGGRCSRLNVFYTENTEIPFEVDSSGAAYMEVGNALEKVLADGLQRNDNLISSNFRFMKPDYAPVSGKIDIVFVDDENELAIGEIKSCGKLPSRPKLTHFIQAQTYSVMAGFDKTYLIYISRTIQESWGDGLAIKTFKVPTLPSELLVRALTIAESSVSVKNKVVFPKLGHFRKSSECVFCPFIPFCWDEQDTDTFSDLMFLQEETERFEHYSNMAENLAHRIIENREERFQDNLRTLVGTSLSKSGKKLIKTLIK